MFKIRGFQIALSRADILIDNLSKHAVHFNTLRTGSFKLFKRPFPGFLTILTP
jgi:hypothetical protein